MKTIFDLVKKENIFTLNEGGSVERIDENTNDWIGCPLPLWDKTVIIKQTTKYVYFVCWDEHTHNVECTALYRKELRKEQE